MLVLKPPFLSLVALFRRLFVSDRAFWLGRLGFGFVGCVFGLGLLFSVVTLPSVLQISASIRQWLLY